MGPSLYGGGGGAAGGGGGTTYQQPQQQQMPRPQGPRRTSGPMMGLQAAGPQTMGGSSGGAGGTRAPYAASALANQRIQSNYNQPFLNGMGGYTYAEGQQPTAMGYDETGRAFYGFGPDGAPIYTPTQNYVQFGPGEGPGNIHAPRNTGPMQPQQQPGGGLIGPFPTLPRIPDMGPVDDTQAAAEAYARAKDTAGRQGRAALDALQDVQGARGIVGSGIGVNEAGGVVGEAARQLGDFNSQQLQMRVENERRRREINYQGGINQRGQDYSGRNLEMERLRWNAGRSPSGSTQNPYPMPQF